MPDQKAIAIVVEVLAEQGVDLGQPYTSKIRGSRHSHMRELRIQSAGKPIRILYAFDPKRTAILLIGAHKSDNKRFYKKLLPVADRLYDSHVEELKKGGSETWEAITHGRN